MHAYSAQLFIKNENNRARAIDGAEGNMDIYVTDKICNWNRKIY